MCCQPIYRVYVYTFRCMLDLAGSLRTNANTGCLQVSSCDHLPSAVPFSFYVAPPARNRAGVQHIDRKSASDYRVAKESIETSAEAAPAMDPKTRTKIVCRPRVITPATNSGVFDSRFRRREEHLPQLARASENRQTYPCFHAQHLQGAVSQNGEAEFLT